MGLKDCRIILHNSSDVYCGQTLIGIVEYTFDAPTKIREISIKFEGRASTSRSDTSDDVTTHYSGDEEYFARSFSLIRPSCTMFGDEMELPVGTHTYPFSFTLPNSLPPSFEGTFGFIRYAINSTLDWSRKPNVETKLPFTVIVPLDLNSDPANKLPLHIHLRKRYGCFCCKSGALLLDLNLPVSGYCSGQLIPIDVSCENGSRVNIFDFQIVLKKTVKYHFKMPSETTKTEKDLIAELSLGQLASNSSKVWREYIQLPELPPSNLKDCRIIDLYYKITIRCVPNGCHLDSEGKSAIILGTVPVAGFECLPPEGSNWLSKADSPLLPLQRPLPSAPALPQSSPPPELNLLPLAPFGASSLIQDQSSMGIIHDEKKRISSPPPYQGGQSSTGITQYEKDKITSPPSYQGGQSSMGITQDEKDKTTSPPPYEEGQSSTEMTQDEIDHQNRIGIPPPYASFAGYSYPYQ